MSSCRRGFTLMEAVVAVFVLGAGAVAFVPLLDTFGRLRAAERLQAEAFVEAVHKVESFVENPPPCDSVKMLSPYVALAEIFVEIQVPPPAHPVRLKRVVQCELKK